MNEELFLLYCFNLQTKFDSFQCFLWNFPTNLADLDGAVCPKTDSHVSRTDCTFYAVQLFWPTWFIEETNWKKWKEKESLRQLIGTECQLVSWNWTFNHYFFYIVKGSVDVLVLAISDFWRCLNVLLNQFLRNLISKILRK